MIYYTYLSNKRKQKVTNGKVICFLSLIIDQINLCILLNICLNLSGDNAINSKLLSVAPKVFPQVCSNCRKCKMFCQHTQQEKSQSYKHVSVRK